MNDKTPRGGPSGDGPSGDEPSGDGPHSGWLNKPRSPHRELPALIEGDLSQELPRELSAATRRLFPLRPSDPLDVTGRGRVTTTESLTGKKPKRLICSQCGNDVNAVTFDANGGNGKCSSCVGEGALVRPVTQAKCEACGQNLP